MARLIPERWFPHRLPRLYQCGGPAEGALPNDVPFNGTPPEYRGPDDFAQQLIDAPRSVRLRTVERRLHLRKWRRFLNRPWSPPCAFPAAIEKIEAEYPAFIPLSVAVDLMAFGTDSCPAEVIEQDARRRQATRELWKGAYYAIAELTAVTADGANAPYGRWGVAFWDTGTAVIPTYGVYLVREDSSQVASIPEPSTWAMMLLGFAGVASMTYRRKSNPALMAA